MRWSRSHLFAPRLQLLLCPWLVAFACAFTGVGAMSATSARPTTCGTWHRDVESSALLADVVLEGRVREKAFLANQPPSGDRTGAAGWYNVTVQVRKEILKGEERVNQGKKASKLLIGKFVRLEDGAVLSNEASVGDGGAGAGDVEEDRDGGGGSSEVDVAGRDWSDCVADLDDGATYIFFLRDVGEDKGKYFEISALPVKKTRRESRLVAKILKKNAAQVPVVQSIQGSKRVTSGSSLTLRCKAKGKPTPDYSWYRDGKELRSGKGVSIKNNKRGSRLKISKARADDQGVYECVASNVLGNARKNITVEVRKFRSSESDDVYNKYSYMIEEASGSQGYGRIITVGVKTIYKTCEKQTFCFNGGTCRYIPELQQTFCECPKQWAGQRCELLDNLSIQNDFSRQSTLLYERTLIIFGIVIAVLVFLVICIASYFLANRRRKRGEAKREMKRNGDPESEQLVKKPDTGSKGQHALNRSLSSHQETQTDPFTYLLDPHSNGYERFTSHPSNPTVNFFQLDTTFPMISSATAAPATSLAPVYANSQRSGGDRDLAPERREPRQRLKAADEAPRGWTSAKTPGRAIAPAASGGNSPEIVELTGPEPGGHVAGSRDPKDPGDPRLAAAEGFLPLVELPDVTPSLPLKMEVQPKANVYAQMKRQPATKANGAAVAATPRSDVPLMRRVAPPPGEQAPSTARVVDVSFPPMNGVLYGDSDEEESAASTLLRLHISEEDLSGTPGGHKASRQTPPSLALAAEPRPDSFSAPFPPAAAVRAANSSSFSEDDSRGFPVRNVSSSEGGSPPLFSAAAARDGWYAFDPAMDSDPNELLDQFMHCSPTKSLHAVQDDRFRLRDVPDNQDAIAI